MNENNETKNDMPMIEESPAPKYGVGGQSRQAVSDSPSSGSVVACDDASASAERGLSNTPAASPPLPKPYGVATSIDWLRVRFNGLFKPSSSGDWIWKPLFDALHIDPMVFEDRKGVQGYARGYQYADHIYVFAGGASTRNSKDEDTFILELSGQGCREFERIVVDEQWRNNMPNPSRTESYDEWEAKIKFDAWAKFINTIVDLGGICTRLDIPTDDLSGLVPFEELKEKIIS